MKKRTGINYGRKYAAITLAAVTAACTGAAAGSAVTVAAAEENKTLVYAGESESTINPLLNNHDELPDLIFSGLMKYDANGKPVEDLAESYTFDKDTNTYTFKLRDGVKWHDGEDFNAEDVVYTYKELTEDETLGASITSNYQDITSIEAPDDQTVIFTLDQYDAAMLDYFTMGILPEHLLEGEDVNTTSFNQNPVGTGRYKFEDWDATGGMITLKRNEDYYGKVPNIETVVYRTVSDETTKAAMQDPPRRTGAWLPL